MGAFVQDKGSISTQRQKGRLVNTGRWDHWGDVWEKIIWRRWIYHRYATRLSLGNCFQNEETRSSLVVQWLQLCTSTAEGMGSIPGQGLRFHKLCGEKKKNKNNSITLQERGAWEKGPHNTIVGAESKWASINGKTKQAVRKGENLTWFIPQNPPKDSEVSGISRRGHKGEAGREGCYRRENSQKTT